ncbi:MAG: GatB/YqeY domain-containing protein [Clostridiales bacterium]|nr:GatB/YqeY domain-containing protein [Clostridiales bacterium]
MTLKDKLASDIKQAMKNKDIIAKNIITLVRADVKRLEVDNRIELDDSEVEKVIVKQVKQLRKALDEFTRANRADLIEQTQNEIAFLENYLPKQLTEEEIHDIVQGAIKTANATSMRDMGKVMGLVSEKTKDRADGKAVSQMVKKYLNV